MIKKLALFLFLFLFIGAAQSAEILEAVCKVHAGNAMGSGTCIDIHNGAVYVFTNYHVVGSNKNVTCQFYNSGHESIEVRGQVIWTAFRKNDSVDMAIIGIPEASFGEYKPEIIKFGAPNQPLDISDTIITVGCPEGKWPALVKGHITEHSNGVYYIKPPVENGRSGSALLDAKTGNIIGIITWRSGDNYDGFGMAQDLETIYAAMSNQISLRKIDYKAKWWNPRSGFLFAMKHGLLPEPQATEFAVEVNANCPGGNCQPQPYGFGQNQGPYNPQGPSDAYPNGGRLFPTLPNEGGGGSSPFPSNPNLPQPTPAPDLSEKFDEMQELYKSLEKSVTDGFVVIDERLGGLDTKVGDISERVNNLEKKNFVTPGLLDKTLKDKDFITPGHLESYVKNTELNAVVEQTVSGFTSVNEKVSNIENNVKSELDNTNNRVEEVGMENNTWYELLAQSLGLSIPGGGFLAWGLYLLGSKIKSALGGAQIPFPVNHQR